jgi:nucleoside-diphosphate-sugar epimerase
MRTAHLRLFVAGATGAIGRQLVPMSVARGHDVIGTTRSEERARWLTTVGAVTAIVDAFDPERLHDEVIAARPDVVIHQLTDLAAGFGPEQMRATAKLREVGTSHLVAATVAAGARRLVAQSVAWLYAPGTLPHTEDDPLWDPTARPDDAVLPGVLALERMVTATATLEGLVLRYGFLYGPGTASESPDRTPSVHIVAAARAALLAAERGPVGIYDIVDDGDEVSNAKARALLAWEPCER